MEMLKITRHTTNEQIERYIKENPHCSPKVIRAQALHERRIKRSQHKKELRNWDIGKSNASVSEYWSRVGGHPPPEQQDK